MAWGLDTYRTNFHIEMTSLIHLKTPEPLASERWFGRLTRDLLLSLGAAREPEIKGETGGNRQGGASGRSSPPQRPPGRLRDLGLRVEASLSARGLRRPSASRWFLSVGAAHSGGPVAAPNGPGPAASSKAGRNEGKEKQTL
ncbi:uncharacterized protein PHA67_016263 [Liasis olivaceus]